MSIKWEDHKELNDLKDILSPKYEPVAYLGGGGFGKVFKVKDKILDRECALKVLNRSKLNLEEKYQQERIKKRFIREAQGYAKCEHNNVVRIFEVGEAD